MATKNSAFMKPMTISADLAAVVGNGPMPRSEVVSKLWVYIKANNLQDAKDKRVIKPDEKLGKVLGSAPINMMKMGGAISKHVS
jgi:chromatin remodeling complex protein RSC6